VLLDVFVCFLTINLLIVVFVAFFFLGVFVCFFSCFAFRLGQGEYEYCGKPALSWHAGWYAQLYGPTDQPKNKLKPNQKQIVDNLCLLCLLHFFLFVCLHVFIFFFVHALLFGWVRPQG